MGADARPSESRPGGRARGDARQQLAGVQHADAIVDLLARARAIGKTVGQRQRDGEQAAHHRDRGQVSLRERGDRERDRAQRQRQLALAAIKPQTRGTLTRSLLAFIR
jgi:hypothetical protein